MTQLGFRAYGLILVLAVLAAATVAWFEAKRKDKTVGTFLDVLLVALFGGLVGARVYHLVHQWQFYSRNLLDAIKLWQGGLGIYGGILGGVVAIFIYTRVKKLDFLKWLDIAAVGLPLGQAIGRWGNFANREIYGLPTNLPWGIYIAPGNRLPELIRFSRFHPLFLYESIWNIGVFLAVLIVAKKFGSPSLRKGELFALYLGLYSLGRFWLEFLRPEVWRVFGLPVAQIIAVVTIAFCSLAFTLRHFRV